MQHVTNKWSANSADRGPSREVRVEDWTGRVFYASHCRFFLDVPLDMSGIIMNAAREATQHGYRLAAGGATLATDEIFRGAVLVELERAARPIGVNVVRFDSEVLVRVLPDKGVQLRAELKELTHWSSDLGFEISGRYVEYATRSSSDSVRPHAVYASLRGEQALLAPSRSA